VHGKNLEVLAKQLPVHMLMANTRKVM